MQRLQQGGATHPQREGRNVDHVLVHQGGKLREGVAMPLESRHKQAQNEICTLQAEGYPSRCTAEAAPYTVACGTRPAARGMQRGSRHDLAD